MKLVVYLRVLQPQLVSQLLPVRLADVLLLLECSLEPLPLGVREDCPSQHAPAGLAPQG